MKMAKGFQILTKVQSADGVGMAGKQLRFQANGAKITGDSQDLGSGDYKTRFRPQVRVQLVIATVRTGGSENPFRESSPFTRSTPNDGLSKLDDHGAHTR